MRRIRVPIVPALIVAGAGLVHATPAAGQSLQLAELFVEQGHLDDARAEVDAWFEIRGDAGSAAEIQHGLWLRGRLLPDRAAARAQLEQLVASYPDGPYTARALNWLADAAAQAGEEEIARAYQARVVRDFAGSPAALIARDWLDSRGVPVPPVVAAADTVAAAPPRTDTVAPPAPAADTAAAIDTATVTQPRTDTPQADTVAAPAPGVDTAAVALPRTDTVAAPVPAAEAAAVAPPPADADPELPEAASGPPLPGAAEGGAYTVQIGAFRNPVGAGGLVDELVADGVDARLVGVPGSALYRVRVGRFATVAEAEAALAALRQAGRDGAVASDARRELAVTR